MSVGVERCRQVFNERGKTSNTHVVAVEITHKQFMAQRVQLLPNRVGARAAVWVGWNLVPGFEKSRQ